MIKVERKNFVFSKNFENYLDYFYKNLYIFSEYESSSFGTIHYYFIQFFPLILTTCIYETELFRFMIM